MSRATLIATLASRPSADGRELAALPPEVDILEVRADLTGELDPDWLRSHFSGRLLYTLRSQAEGGLFEGSPVRRRRRLLQASQRFDLVDLEGDRDLSAAMLDEIPHAKRILSWHGSALKLADLRDRFESLSSVDAWLYKLVPLAGRSGEELVPLDLLHSLRRADVLAFAAGPIGAWTRLLAARVGAPVVFGSIGSSPAAPGQPSVHSLCADFGLPELAPIDRLFGVVGNPVAHSLSPRLHNAAYRDLGIPALYLPFHVEVFGEFWLEVVESPAVHLLSVPLRGLSVTTPFKEAALAVAGASSPLADRIGAANTLVSTEGVWEAENTDAAGVARSVSKRGLNLHNVSAAVVGCGGAGRAAALGLAQAGARVTLVNRGRERGEQAALDLGLPFLPLQDLRPGDFQLLVHATPLGRGAGERPPIAIEELAPETVVVDLVYGNEPTELVQAARASGCKGVDGREVLLYQAAAQFQMMTGYEMDVEAGRRQLGLGEA